MKFTAYIDITPATELDAQAVRRHRSALSAITELGKRGLLPCDDERLAVISRVVDSLSADDADDADDAAPPNLAPELTDTAYRYAERVDIDTVPSWQNDLFRSLGLDQMHVPRIISMLRGEDPTLPCWPLLATGYGWCVAGQSMCRNIADSMPRDVGAEIAHVHRLFSVVAERGGWIEMRTC